MNKEDKYIFRTIIQDYGIFKFSAKPISEASKFHFDISELSDSDIDKILTERNIEKIESNSKVSSLSGGIAVIENNIPVIEPTCCNSLQSIMVWEAILKSDQNRWRRLWIGHPWIYYKVTNDSVHFSDYTETGMEEYMEGEQSIIEPIRVISILELKNQLNKMRVELDNFKLKLQNKLDSIGIISNNGFVNDLVGLED